MAGLVMRCADPSRRRAGAPARFVRFALLAAGLAGAAYGAPPSAGLIDPTQPPAGYLASLAGPDGAAAPPPEPVRLQMIARNGAARLAVINGHRVRSGDSLTLAGKSSTVVAIRDDAVVLEQEGRRQTLELIPHIGVRAPCGADASRRPSCRDDSPGVPR